MSAQRGIPLQTMTVQQHKTSREEPEHETSGHPPLPPRFEPAVMERIIARAGALQEAHRQTLSREQMEEIAAEVGIQPEFVQLALEQDREEGYSQSRAVIGSAEGAGRQNRRIALTSTAAACGIAAAAYLMPFPDSAGTIAIPLRTFVLPLLLCACLGMIGRSRRSGAVSGAAVAGTTLIALLILHELRGGPFEPFNAQSIRGLSLWIGACALAGAAGAQTRHLIVKRRAPNRRRRTVKGSVGL